MGKKVYSILVNEGANEYILGRISGMFQALSKNNDRFGYATYQLKDRPGVWVIRIKTTYWNYRKAQKCIEKHYPGLCEFQKYEMVLKDVGA